MEKRREKPELRMRKPKTSAPLGDAAFAQNDTLLAVPQRLANQRPFFKAMHQRRKGRRMKDEGWRMEDGGTFPLHPSSFILHPFSLHAVQHRSALPFVVLRRWREQPRGDDRHGETKRAARLR